MTETTKRLDVRKMVPGTFVWMMTGYPELTTPNLLVFLRYVDTPEGQQAIMLGYPDPGQWDLDALQERHDKYVAADLPSELKPWCDHARSQILYFAEERYDPSRWVEWHHYAEHVPQQLPELFIAWLATEAEPQNDRYHYQLIDVARKLRKQGEVNES